jgi:hypothetical protein
MSVLSVDLGHQYVAYAFLQISEPKNIRYGIYDFGKEKDCISRCQCVSTFLQQIKPHWLVIEKQVGRNYKCMQLQYALTAAAAVMDIKVQLQPAWIKFEVFDQPCDTRGKAHKILSTNMALEWLNLNTYEDVSDIPLSQYAKKDDIADAINMLRAFIETGSGGVED